MSLIFRLAGKVSKLQISGCQRSGLLNFVRPVTLKCTPYTPPKNENHDERNTRLGRPQSPHLTIYQPQLTSVLSVSHRATGMVLSAYTIAFGMGAVFLGFPIEYWIEQLRCAEVGPAFIFALKFALAFPLTYHFWNGIRHLLWDTGKLLSIREVYATGYAMLTITIVTALVLAGCS